MSVKIRVITAGRGGGRPGEAAPCCLARSAAAMPRRARQNGPSVRWRAAPSSARQPAMAPAPRGWRRVGSTIGARAGTGFAAGASGTAGRTDVSAAGSRARFRRWAASGCSGQLAASGTGISLVTSCAPGALRLALRRSATRGGALRRSDTRRTLTRLSARCRPISRARRIFRRDEHVGRAPDQHEVLDVIASHDHELAAVDDWR